MAAKPRHQATNRIRTRTGPPARAGATLPEAASTTVRRCSYTWLSTTPVSGVMGISGPAARAAIFGEEERQGAPRPETMRFGQKSAELVSLRPHYRLCQPSTTELARPRSASEKNAMDLLWATKLPRPRHSMACALAEMRRGWRSADFRFLRTRKWLIPRSALRPRRANSRPKPRGSVGRDRDPLKILRCSSRALSPGRKSQWRKGWRPPGAVRKVYKPFVILIDIHPRYSFPIGHAPLSYCPRQREYSQRWEVGRQNSILCSFQIVGFRQ